MNSKALLHLLMPPCYAHNVSVEHSSALRTRIAIDLWGNHFRSRGNCGVAGEGRLVGVPKFHSWGKCTLPSTVQRLPPACDYIS